MIRSWCHLRRIEDKVVVKWEIVKLGVIGQVQVVLKSCSSNLFASTFPNQSVK